MVIFKNFLAGRQKCVVFTKRQRIQTSRLSGRSECSICIFLMLLILYTECLKTGTEVSNEHDLDVWEWIDYSNTILYEQSS